MDADAAERARQAGWTALVDLVSPADVAEILRSCDELLSLAPSQQRAGDKVVSGTRHLNELDERIPLVADVVGRPTLVDCVKALMQPDEGFEASIDQISYRSPQPGFGAQRLHADAPPLLAPAPTDVVTAIVALTRFTERNGATRLVPGSHQRPDLQRLAGGLEHHDDEISLTGEAGTAFVFNGHVLHSGTTNESSDERPALQLVWRRRPSA